MPGRDDIDRRSPRGKEALDRRIKGFLIAAKHGQRLLILRDLDSDAVCPGALISRLLAAPHERPCLRIAVRAAEAWLLADRQGAARHLRVPLCRIPRDVEALDAPKRILASIGTESRDAAIHRIFNGGAQARAGWTDQFIRDGWSIARALQSGVSPSLERAVQRLAALAMD